jgi:hypothetical protein
MTTLIAVYTSSGCVGRCDAKCYSAEGGTPCDCICQGKNHGAGRQQALDNTRELARQWVHAAEVKQGRTLFGGMCDDAAPELF